MLRMADNIQAHAPTNGHNWKQPTSLRRQCTGDNQNICPGGAASRDGLNAETEW